MTREAPVYQFLFLSAFIHGAALGGVGHFLSSDPEIDFADDRAASLSVRLKSSSTDERLLEPPRELVEPMVHKPQPIARYSMSRKIPTAIPKRPSKPEPVSTEPKPAAPEPAGGIGDQRNSPQIMNAPKPPYPRRARKIGFEGTLRLLALVKKDGYVSAVKLLKSSGRTDCDEAAKRTVLDKWRFQPATRLGRTVEAETTIAVTFSLR